MSGAWAQAFAMVFDPYNIVVMLGASLFGLFVGAVPGLTATIWFPKRRKPTTQSGARSRSVAISL